MLFTHPIQHEVSKQELASAKLLIENCRTQKPKNNQERYHQAQAYYQLAVGKDTSENKARMYINSSISLLQKNIKKINRNSYNDMLLLAQAYHLRHLILCQQEHFDAASHDLMQIISMINAYSKYNNSEFNYLDLELYLFQLDCVVQHLLLIKLTVPSLNQALIQYFLHSCEYIYVTLDMLQEYCELDDNIFYQQFGFANMFVGYVNTSVNYNIAKSDLDLAILYSNLLDFNNFSDPKITIFAYSCASLAKAYIKSHYSITDDTNDCILISQLYHFLYYCFSSDMEHNINVNWDNLFSIVENITADFDIMLEYPEILNHIASAIYLLQLCIVNKIDINSNLITEYTKFNLEEYIQTFIIYLHNMYYAMHVAYYDSEYLADACDTFCEIFNDLQQPNQLIFSTIPHINLKEKELCL